MKRFKNKWLVLVLVLVVVASIVIMVLPKDSNVANSNANSDVAGDTTSDVVSLESEGWSLYFENLKVVDKLSTTESIPLYDGGTEQVLHEDFPSEGNSYVLADVEVTKNSGANSIDLSQIKLSIGEEIYSRVPDSTFLSNHNMTVLPTRIISLGTQKGSVFFEVPTASLNDSSTESLVLSYGETLFLDSKERTDLTTNITKKKDPFIAQTEIEAQMLEAFEKGEYTLDNPMVVLNPYGSAPLTALAMFETEELATVEIVVQGKTEDVDIVKSFDTPSTFHEIPVLGLYAGVRNQVDIIVKTESGEEKTSSIYIDTEPLPENYVNVEVTTNTGDMEPGMTFLYDEQKNVIDKQGDVRWYSSLLTNEFFNLELENNHILTKTGGEWEGNATLFERDRLGKLYNVYFVPDGAHHDVEELPNGNLLVATNAVDNGTVEDKIIEIDRYTGEIIKEIDLCDILDYNRISTTRVPENDWAHLNAIHYYEDSILISCRFQNAVVQLSYPELEIEWILGTHDGWTEKYTPYLLDPIGDNFEWQWGQHDPEVLADVDNNPDTTDILLFDNGFPRDFNYSIDGQYSRFVQYRINMEDMTVEQIRTYGELRGDEIYAASRSGVDYYPITGNWGGVFTDIHKDKDGNAVLAKYEKKVEDYTVIVEINPNNEVVWEAVLKNSYTNKYTSYRTDRGDLYTCMEEYSVENVIKNTVFTDTAIKNTKDKLQPVHIEISDTVKYAFDKISLDGGCLSLNGWGIIPMVPSSEYITKIVFESDTQTYAMPVKSGIRKDITQARVADNIDYDKSGIVLTNCYVDLLPPGEYKVGVMIEGQGKCGYSTVSIKGESYYFTVAEDGSTVPTVDLIETQAAVDASLQAEYASADYTLSNPLVMVDPYDLSPLSAITMFKTEKPATISITVAGIDGGKTLTNDFGDKFTTDHTIPVYGLYAEKETDVTITATFEDGTTDTNTISVAGHALPELLDCMEVDSVKEGAADNLIFCQPPSRVGVAYAFDNKSDIRWVFSDKNIAVATAMIQLGNGHFFTNSEKTMGSLYAESLYEMDYTGKIYKEYMINNIHHDTAVMSNGNILVASGDYDNNTLEDAVFELDGKTGAVLSYWDMAQYFRVGNITEDGELTGEITYGIDTLDWLHINSIEYRESDNSMVISGRKQDAVFKINLDTGELAWVLSEPNDLWTDAVADKLLTPVGDLENFEWQYGQHNATWLPNGDLMLFDNGTFRAKTKEEIPPVEESYSRVVVYRIDEEAGTVEHVWQYGKELGRDYLSTFISSAQYLGENHYFMDFGGGQTNDEGEHQYIGGPNRVAQIVEWKDGEVVFEASNESKGITAGTYQALRLNIYNCTSELDLTQKGVRLGSNFKSNYVEETTLDTKSENTFKVDRLTVEDNGTQLSLFTVLDKVEKDDVLTLYMVGEKTYSYPVTAKDVTVEAKLNTTELPKDRYHLYLTRNDEICDLEKEWNVKVEPRPVPTCYDITVTSNMQQAGWTSENGFYAEDTAVTLNAEAYEGYTFAGWQQDGKIVSTDPIYSFIPNKNATFTAIFQ